MSSDSRCTPSQSLRTAGFPHLYCSRSAETTPTAAQHAAAIRSPPPPPEQQSQPTPHPDRHSHPATPHPPIDDEPMSPHHQQLIPIQDHHHRGLGQPQYALLELHSVRQLDRSNALPHATCVINQAFTTNRPPRRFHAVSPIGHAQIAAGQLQPLRRYDKQFLC